MKEKSPIEALDFISLGSLAAWEHLPSGKSKARILLVHGMGEHSARHHHTIEFLVSKGYEVVRFDLRGAGRSGGRRQWVDRFEDYVEDLAQVHSWILREKKTLPLILLGHSLGGAISIHFASSYGNALNGLILSSPAFLPGDGVSPVKIAVGKMLTRLAPNLRVPGSLERGTLSRDPEVETLYRADPLCSHFNTVRQGTEILRALDEIPEKAARIQTPTLIAHGTDDRIVQLAGSYQILRLLGSAQKEMQVLPLTRHEPHNDLDRGEYFTRLHQWIQKRIS